MISEDGIITYLKSQFPQQIGDDAAVLPFNEHQSYVISQDLLIEDIHFRKHYQSPESLAHKALHVNLSDIAAMGAIPQTVLLGLSIPVTDQTYIESFLKHFTQICDKANVILIGGDTTAAPQNQLFISVTVLGTACTSQLKYRSHAQINDVICVVGHIGAAHIGFLALEKNEPGLLMYKDCFLNPRAKTEEGIWLGQQSEVHAMMDLSDGVYTDLQKLLQASNCGALIPLENLKPSNQIVEACQQLAIDPLETQLSGGEDYGLLFTISPVHFSEISREFENQFHYPIQKIGTITEHSECIFTQNHVQIIPKINPFAHF